MVVVEIFMGLIVFVHSELSFPTITVVTLFAGDELFGKVEAFSMRFS